MRGIYYYILCHTVIVIIIFILENPATHQKYKSTHFTQSRGVSIRSVQIMTDSLLGKPRAYFEKKKDGNTKTVYIKWSSNLYSTRNTRMVFQTFPSLHTSIMRC